jgi:iron-regulated transporter 1
LSYSYEDSSYEDLDEYNYYGDDDTEYYEEYGTYAEGYDEYYDYYDEDVDNDVVNDCTVGADKKIKLANGTAACDLKLEGVDKQATKLKGGIDGIYKLDGCHHGRAVYKREKSPKGEDRVLFYSNKFGDWDVVNASTTNSDDVLLYGGEFVHAVSPLFVKEWHIGNDLISAPLTSSLEDYTPINGTFKCADGKVFKPPVVNKALQKAGPVITDDEMQDRLKLIYEKYSRRPDPSPTLNFTFVLLLVMVGLTIVLAIPYFLVGKKNAKGYQPVATSFAQVIQQSKKKQSGHTN